MRFLRQLLVSKRQSLSVSRAPYRSRAEYHLTSQQVQKVLSVAVNGRDKLILALMAGTGMRRFEVANLDIADVRLSENLLIVRHGKGNKSRIIPITPQLSSLLRSHTGKRTSGAVFLSRLNNRLCTRQLNRIVESAGIKAGILHPDPRCRTLNCHLFRHTFARLWKDAGGSIESLSSILGHASQATTLDLYGREGLSDVRNNYAKTMKKIGID